MSTTPLGAAADAPSSATVAASVNPCTATAAYADEISDAGSVVWQASLPPGQVQDLPSPLVINGDAVFAGIDDLTGLRATDGHRLWGIHIKSGQVLSSRFNQLWQWDGSAIALIDYSNTDWRVVAIDPATGKVRWQLKFGTRTDAIPVVSADGVLALAAGQYIYAVNLTTGHLLWSRKFVKPDSVGNYSAELAISNGVVVADYTELVPLKAGVLAGFGEKTGAQLWSRTGIPQEPSLQAAADIVYLFGINENGGKQLPQPLTALSAANGKTLWRASPGYLYTLWTAPGQVIFASRTGMYDVNPATGVTRWKVPGETSGPNLPPDLLFTATDAVYFPDYFPSRSLTDRRLNDGTVAWTQPAAQPGIGDTAIVAPDGPNALIAASNNFDDAPQTRVYVVNLRTGKLAATTNLPSDLSANPTVTGSDAIYQLNPEACEYA